VPCGVVANVCRIQGSTEESKIPFLKGSPERERALLSKHSLFDRARVPIPTEEYVVPESRNAGKVSTDDDDNDAVHLADHDAR
jgi:hypothetical protein